MVSYRAVLQIVEAALLSVPGRVSAEILGDFVHILRICEDDFRNLLARPPPREEDKAQVLAREVRLPDSLPTVLDSQDVQIVLKLSQDFNLNEIDSTALLVAAHHEWSIVGREPLEILRLAGGLYLTERRSLLTALNLLLRAVVLEEEIDQSVASDTKRQVSILLRGGLRGRLLALLRELNREEPAGSGGPEAEPYVRDQRGVLVLRRNVAQRERLLVAQCLVYTALITRIGPLEAKEILQLLKEAASNWSRFPADSVRLQVAYTLMFSLVNALVSDSLASSAASAADSPALLVPDSAFRKDFQQQILAKHPHPTLGDALLVVVRLAWAAFLLNATGGSTSSDDAAIRACLDVPSMGAAFQFLTHGILRSPVFQNDDSDLLYLYTAYLHKLLCTLLTQPLACELIKTIKDAAIDAPDDSVTDDGSPESDGPGGTLPTALPPSGQVVRPVEVFLALMRLVGEVYMREPELMVDNAALRSFVLSAGQEHRGYRTLTAFLELLTALSTGEEGARQMYRLLQERTFRHVSWATLFHTLVSYDQRFRESTRANGPRPSSVLPASSHALLPLGDTLALRAYLKCLQKVVEEGAEADRASWFPDIEPLFRLLQYEGVPPSLKGALRGAVRSFVPIGPAVRDVIWSLLQHYDLPVNAAIAPAPGGLAQQGYDLTYELTEVEARLEEYPSTLSYLELVNSLVAVESALLADEGRRYSAYFQFVRDQVFIPHAQRAFADPSEKWQIVVACLTHFLAMLAAFRPPKGEPLPGASQGESDGDEGVNPPGQEIMKDLLSGRGLFRNLIAILMLGADAVVEERATQPHGAFLEDAARLALQILVEAFAKDLPLADKWRPACSPLDIVLCHDNRQIVAILGFVRYEASLEIQLSAIQIMTVLSTRVVQLVPILLEEGAAEQLREDYAACLESWVQTPHPPVDANQDLGLLILQLALSNLSFPAPNVAHLLLGFDVDRGVERSTLQPKRDYSCLRVLLDMLETMAGPDTNARLHQSGLQLIHALATDTVTAGAMIELLRTEKYAFFSQHLARLASQTLPKQGSSQMLRVSSLQQRAWLLKLAALSLHTADADFASHRDSCRLLIGLLFSQQRDGDVAVSNADLALALPGDATHGFQKIRVLEILDLVQFRLPEARPDFSPQVQALHSALHVNDILSSPSLVEDGGIWQLSPSGERLIDVDAFKDAMWQEYVALEGQVALGPSGGERAAALRDAVQVALKWAWKFNRTNQEQAAQLHLTAAWAQLVEIAVARRYEFVAQLGQSQILFDIMDAALAAMLSPDCSTPMAIPLSEVAMMIMAKLQEQSVAPPVDVDASSDSSYLDLLAMPRLPIASCHALLAKLIKAILRPESSSGLRRRLYGTLLIYLQYCRGGASRDYPLSLMRGLQADGSSDEVDADVAKLERAEAELSSGNFEIIYREAVPLVEAMARDAAHGADMARSLAFSTLSSLLTEDRQLAAVLPQLQTQGVLQACLADIASESTYQAVALPSADSLRQLYTLEAQLGLLLQVAHQGRTRGAHVLLTMGALRQLSACHALDIPLQDDEDEEDGANDELPNQRERHHQLAAPVLRLVLCLSATMDASAPPSKGHSGDDPGSQICGFIASHEGMIRRVLLDSSPVPRGSDLELLELATAILCQVLPQESHRDRWGLQVVLLSLACSYFVPPGEPQVKYVRKIWGAADSSDASPEDREEARKMAWGLLQVRCHLIAYISKLVANKGLLLRASSRQVADKGGDLKIHAIQGAGLGRRPTLRTLAQFADAALDDLASTLDDKAVILAKLQDVNEVARHELDDLIKSYGQGILALPTDSMRTRRHLALAGLARAAAFRERQVAAQLYVVEHILDILFRNFQAASGPSLAGASLGPVSNGSRTEGMPASRSSGVPDGRPKLNGFAVTKAGGLGFPVLQRGSEARADGIREAGGQQTVPESGDGMDLDRSATIGSKEEIEDVAGRVLPVLNKLEELTEERMGQSMDQVRRMSHWLRSMVLKALEGAGS